MTGSATLPTHVPPVHAAPRTAGGSLPGLPLSDLGALGVAVLVGGTATWPAVGYCIAVFAVLAGRGLHRPRICPRVADHVPTLVGAAVLGLPVALAFLPGAGALRLAGIAAGLLVCCRLVLAVLYRTARRRGLASRPVLLVGADAMGLQIAGILAARSEFGLRPVGFLSDRPADAVLGPPAELVEVAARWGVRQVIVCQQDDDLVDVLRAAVRSGIRVHVVPALAGLGMAVPTSCRDEVWGIPLLALRHNGSAGRLGKRAFDLVVAGVLLVLLAPLLGVLLLAIRLTSGPPVLFRQLRVTGTDRLTEVVKLRTLPEHADADTRWAVPAGATRLGEWLRATHLDELPQLVDVLRGDMSLVGPRPERPYFAARFARRIPHYAGRQRMPAGITGWAQVHGLHGDTPMADRVRFDNYYVEYWTPWLDLVVLARTLASPWQRGGSGEGPACDHRLGGRRRRTPIAFRSPAHQAHRRGGHAVQPGAGRGHDPGRRHPGT